MADYISQFTGGEIDRRLAKVSELEAGKQDKLVSGENIKTIGGQSVLGEGNIPLTDQEAVKFTPQTLTDAQKAQALANIGAASEDEVAALADQKYEGPYESAAALPTASASTMGAIYLVGPDSNGEYDRYVTKVDGSTYTWGSLGKTSIDLSNYATKAEVGELEAKVTYGEETQIQGTLEPGYFGTVGRNTAGYVKVFDVSGLNTLVRVTTNTNNPYVVLWALSAVQVNVGDNYSNTLAHSGVTSDINEDTIDLSLYPTAKYLYVANFDNTDISSAYARTGGLIDINGHLSSLDDSVSRIDDSLANTNEDVDSLDETINGQERTIETIIQSVSTLTKARIDNALMRVYLSVYNSTLAVKFYPIVQGKEYSIHIPKMWNEYTYYWGYTNNYPPSGELTQAWDSVNGLIADTTTGEGEKTINITSAANYGYIAVCYDTTGGDPTVKQYEVIIENGIKQDTQRLISEEDTVSVNLPDKIFAVVGDKLQLFYRGIIKAIDPYKYDIVVSCSKGNAFPRYYELTPTVSETLDFSISVKNAKGTILAEGSTQIVCKNATSPGTLKNILCFGDSLTSGGEWVNEANRRLTLDTVVDGIAGSNLNNIAFCGSKTTPNGAGYFGVGGWSWGTYMSQGVTMYRANVSNVSSCQVGAVYRVNGYLYEVIEVNITAGTGTILLSKYSSYSQPAPPASGTLVKVGGYGDSEISYSSYVEETYSPLWNNGSADFINYAHENANDQIDVVVTLLTWNDGSGGNDFDNFDSDRNYMTLFGNTLHSQFPAAKWLLLGIQLPSINGGIGQNHGADGVTAWGVTKSVFNKNDFYQEFANDDSFKSFTKFINISSQFDSENNMQEAETRVNIRNTKTEERGTNAVHPALSGYMQIADIVFRSIIGELA